MFGYMTMWNGNFDAPHREKEERAVQFAPKVVSDFTEALQQGVAKVVGVSDKYDLVAEAEKVIQAEFEHGIHARSTTASQDCEPKRLRYSIFSLLPRCHPSEGKQGSGRRMAF